MYSNFLKHVVKCMICNVFRCYTMGGRSLVIKGISLNLQRVF